MTMEEMKKLDYSNIDRNSLVDIASVKINANASRKERIESYLKQIKNPYCYLDHGYMVMIRYADTDLTIEDCIRDYLNKMAV